VAADNTTTYCNSYPQIDLHSGCDTPVVVTTHLLLMHLYRVAPGDGGAGAGGVGGVGGTGGVGSAGEGGGGPGLGAGTSIGRSIV
jgi:hypothetical protein